MSEPILPANDTLPAVKNASPLRLKLLALQPGETLDVIKKDLPASYKTVKPLISSIQNNYDLFFGVLTLNNGRGWRVKRVSTAEEAESFTPKKKKRKAARKDEPLRLYNMTDAELFTLIMEKIAFAKRDIADLTTRGVTLADLNTLDTDAHDFGALPPDNLKQAEEGQAVDIKTAARNTLENRLGNLRTMAENTFSTGTVEYEVFGFEGMAGETDDKLLRIAKRALRQGNANQLLMEVWGCTPAFLLQLAADITAFDNEIDNVYWAEANRKKATVLRVKTGNGLYARLNEVCNTGKDVYRSTSAAKFNDYFIYG